jgi:hypothetical protein
MASTLLDRSRVAAGCRLGHGRCFSSTSIFSATVGARPQFLCCQVLYATGASTWETSNGSCDVAPLKTRLAFPVTITCPTTISLQQSHSALNQHLIKEEANHVSVLTLAWAYVPSARWTDMMPGASAMEYTNSMAVSKTCEHVANGNSALMVGRPW